MDFVKRVGGEILLVSIYGARVRGEPDCCVVFLHGCVVLSL